MNSSSLKTRRVRVLAAVIVLLVLVIASFGAHSAFGDDWAVLLISVQTFLVIALVLRTDQQFRRVERRDRSDAAARREMQAALDHVRRLQRAQRAQGRTVRTDLDRAIELSVQSCTRLDQVVASAEALRRSASIAEMTAIDIRLALGRLESDLTSGTESVKAHVEDVNSRLATAEEHEAGLASIEAALTSNSNRYGFQLRQLFEQIQSTINLFEILDFKAFTPPMRGWAASPDALAVLLREFRKGSPRIALECGSGMSTLVMALAAKQFNPESRVIALEHEERFAKETEALLREHGVSDFAEVRLAPLQPLEGLEGSPLWYDLEAVEDLDGIDLLFVDGPPAATGPLARQPALPALWDRLGPEAVILMDDLIRTDEQQVRDIWKEAHPELQVENIAVEKGIAILRRPAV